MMEQWACKSDKNHYYSPVCNIIQFFANLVNIINYILSFKKKSFMHILIVQARFLNDTYPVRLDIPRKRQAFAPEKSQLQIDLL